MKRNYTLSLVEKDVEELRDRLQKQGVALSAYMQFIIREAVITAKKIEAEGLVPILSASGLLKSAGTMAEHMESGLIIIEEDGKNAKKKKSRVRK
jgi:predicted naringenin-chalcone synthase